MILVLAANAASLSGTVTSVEGAPVSGARVVVYDTRLNYADAETTNDGGFSIVNLPPGRYRMRAMPADSDPQVDRFYPDTWDFCAADVLVVEQGDSLDALDMALPTGGTMGGRLLDSSGDPIAGAQLMAIGASERVSLVSRVTTTDGDGVYAVVGLDSEPGAAEPYLAYVQASGRPRQYLAPSYDDEEAAWFDVEIGVETAIEDESLLEGIRVSGLVTGPDGPLDAGTVYVYSGSQVMTVSVASDGTYDADGLPPGDIVSWCDSAGYATSYYPDADRPGESVPAPDEGMTVTGVDLALGPENTLTLTLDAAGTLDEVSALLYNDTYTVGRGGGFDEAGTMVIDALHPGIYYLMVYGSDIGYVDDYLRDDTGALRAITVDGDTTLTVPLVPASSFSGTVRGTDGLPVYGAAVYATTLDGSDTTTGVTDSDGVYTIDGLPGGAYTLRSAYSAYCPADPGWVSVWWPEALIAADASWTTLADAEVRTNVDFTLPNDDDHDGMGDAWEIEHGLDPTIDDAAGDADHDGYLNGEEWVNGTDPTDESAVQDCGCGSSAGALVLLPLAVLRRRAAKTGTPRSRAFRW